MSYVWSITALLNGAVVILHCYRTVDSIRVVLAFLMQD